MSAWLAHRPDEPRNIGDVHDLVYCMACGRLLSSQRGPAPSARRPCDPVRVALR